MRYTREFNEEAIIHDFKRQSEVGKLQDFITLKVASSLNDLVDIRKSKTVIFLSEKEFKKRYNELLDGEKLMENVFSDYEEYDMLRVYDVEEVTIFGERMLKLYCYDTTVVDF